MPAILTRRTWLILLALCVLNACTTLKKIPLTEQSLKSWEQYQRDVGKISSWDLHARAAIFVDDEVHNFGLNWRHRADEFQMILEAPFGQGAFRLESNRDARLPVELSLPDDRVVYAKTAEAALERVVGWPIPVSGLEWWIKGLPQKNIKFRHELNGDGRLISLNQDNWRINYLQYFDFDESSKGLPKKMYLKHDRLALKIVIEHWQRPEISSDNTELFPDFN